MISIPVIDTTGKKAGTVKVSEQLVMAKPNPQLTSQSVRVYLSNQRQAQSKIQTKKESAYTTAKMYRQKGTGNARHGSKKAAQFVGGVKAHGPTGNQNYSLTLSKKMRKSVLAQALSWHYGQKSLLVIDDLSKVNLKTKDAKDMLKLVCDYPKQSSIVIVLEDSKLPIIQATSNLSGVLTTQVARVNSYELLKHQMVVITKKSLLDLDKRYVNNTPDVDTSLTKEEQK
jgi:large subunit ribosomal protein L4